MIKTIILLLIAVVAIPLAAFYLDDPLSELQREMLHTSVYMMLAVAAYCFIVGELTHNNSQVDKLWSIIPIVYAGYFAYASDWEPRVTLMSMLVAIWGIRLTYNFSRRGAYSWKFWSGEEDYRWQILRKEPMFNTRLKWMLFDLFFICLYQNTLILLFTLPAVMVAGLNTPLNFWDYLLALLMISAIIFEFIADQQQWNYQNEKLKRINSGAPLEGIYKDGFVRSGLWKYVRHPNYAAEQFIWILFYCFSVAATGEWLNWSAAGFVLLLLLFQGSADFSEKISSSKYPAYAEYKKTVGRFLPKIK